MRRRSVWKKLLGLHRAVVEDVWLEDSGAVVSVRPKARERDRCPHCRRRCPGYDWGEGRRRWRALDLGTTFAYLEAWAPRVTCKVHGVVVAAVPWARHDSNFTTAFEDQFAWLAVHTNKTAVAELMRIAWRTVAFDEDAGFPCHGTVIGEEVEVLSVSRADNGSELIATCQRGGRRYEVALLDIHINADATTSRLIAAYRRWTSN